MNTCISLMMHVYNDESVSVSEEWDLKRRDSVTGLVFNVCPCKQRKIWNNEPALCEMNKFVTFLQHKLFLIALSCQRSNSVSSIVKSGLRIP